MNKLENWQNKIWGSGRTMKEATQSECCEGLDAIADDMMHGIHNMAQSSAILDIRYALMSDSERAADYQAAAKALRSIKSDKRAAASRENGKKGGRPKKGLNGEYSTAG